MAQTRRGGSSLKLQYVHLSPSPTLFCCVSFAHVLAQNPAAVPVIAVHSFWALCIILRWKMSETRIHLRRCLLFQGARFIALRVTKATPGPTSGAAFIKKHMAALRSGCVARGMDVESMCAWINRLAGHIFAVVRVDWVESLCFGEDLCAERASQCPMWNECASWRETTWNAKRRAWRANRHPEQSIERARAHVARWDHCFVMEDTWKMNATHWQSGNGQGGAVVLHATLFEKLRACRRLSDRGMQTVYTLCIVYMHCTTVYFVDSAAVHGLAKESARRTALYSRDARRLRARHRRGVCG